MKKNVVIAFVFMLTSSCGPNKPKDGEHYFYTQHSYLEHPSIPLINPIFAYYSKEHDNWSLKIPDNFKETVHIDYINTIGVKKTLIYGKINKTKWSRQGDQKHTFVYATRNGGVSVSSTPLKSQDKVRIYPLDSTDSTTEAFFSKEKYDNYLKEKGIPDKLYDINKHHKQYKETGTTPWFSESLQIKLKR